MQVHRDESSGVTAVSGAMGVDGIEELLSSLIQLVREAPSVRLDLSRVESCDTAALQLLCSTCKHAAELGKPFSVSSVSPALDDVAQLLGIELSSLGYGADYSEGEDHLAG